MAKLEAELVVFLETFVSLMEERTEVLISLREAVETQTEVIQAQGNDRKAIEKFTAETLDHQAEFHTGQIDHDEPLP